MRRNKILNTILRCIVLIMIICSASCRDKSENDGKEILITASNPQEAALGFCEQLFKNGFFADIRISEHELSDYMLLNEYKDMTAEGTVYSYELIYKIKTDDEDMLSENKIKAEKVETGVWLDEVAARCCIVLFEYENVYYRLFSREGIDLSKDFIYNNGEYYGSDTSEKDRLECDILKAVFENQYNIQGLTISDNPPVAAIKNKLIRDIEMFVEPEYEIDENRTRIYNLSFDDEIKCIYFNADLYDKNSNEIVTNKAFSLFLNGGFSVYDIENIVPKSIETK